MKMKAIHVIVVLVVGLLATQAVSGQVMDLKLGMQRTSELSRTLLLSVESRIGERLTFQPQVGFGHRAWKGGLSLDHFHFGLDGRAYLFLRQRRYFCGFYLGPYLTHERLFWRAEGYSAPYSTRHYTSGGLLLGYQQALLGRLRVDGGLKFGCATNVTDRYFNIDGGLEREQSRGFNFIGYLFLQVGYAF